MAVVVRLQKLRDVADSGDIRNFFSGLKIPLGGVHIIGGKLEEAFIIFDSEEDGRRAINRSGGHIRGRTIDVTLSSKSEMERVLEESMKDEDNGSIQDAEGEMFDPDMMAVILKGMPYDTTEEEIGLFFRGLQVDDVIMKFRSNGMKSGMAVVKFKTTEDATEALKRDMQYIRSRYVKVLAVSEKDWLKAVILEKNSKRYMSARRAESPKFRRGLSPAYTQKYQQRHARSCSPVAQQDGGRSRSPLTYRSRLPSPSNKEYCVLLENLPYSAEKSDVKGFFRAADLQDNQILFLLDTEGKRTRSIFVLFRRRRDYLDALSLHKEEFLHRCVYISTIAKEKMISILEKVQRERYGANQERLSTSERRNEMVFSHPETSEHMKEELPERYSRFQERLPPSQSDQYNSERVCIYVQNLPLDVRRVEIIDFFHGFGISEDDVILPSDNTGVRLGEALVIFQTEVQALTAQSLNGQRFLGSELLIRCLERSQMREFGIADSAVRDPTLSERSFESDMKYSDFRVTSDNHIPLTDLQVRIPGGSGVDSSSPYGPLDQGNASFPNDYGNGTLHNRFTPPAQNYGHTILQLVNLPFQTTLDELYDFCYGYRVIPGSVSLQYKPDGSPNGSATVVFESRQEAIAAIDELSGRPIGKRKVQLLFLYP